MFQGKNKDDDTNTWKNEIYKNEEDISTELNKMHCIYDNYIDESEDYLIQLFIATQDLQGMGNRDYAI